MKVGVKTDSCEKVVWKGLVQQPRKVLFNWLVLLWGRENSCAKEKHRRVCAFLFLMLGADTRWAWHRKQGEVQKNSTSTTTTSLSEDAYRRRWTSQNGGPTKIIKLLRPGVDQNIKLETHAKYSYKEIMTSSSLSGGEKISKYILVYFGRFFLFRFYHVLPM